MKLFYVFSEQELVKKNTLQNLQGRFYKVPCVARNLFSVFFKDGYGGKNMAYTKPQVVAQNAAAGSYAAGCPAQGTAAGSSSGCKACERTY